MGLFKKGDKEFRDTTFGKFLNKAKDIVPDLLPVIGNFAIGNFGGAVNEVRKVLKKKAESSQEAKDLLIEFEKFKMTFEKECFELESKDRDSGRKLYMVDSLIQKIFALSFLVGYAFLCYYLLEIIRGESNENDLFKTMVTMIWTGTSVKLGTIVDFFFGGSMKKD